MVSAYSILLVIVAGLWHFDVLVVVIDELIVTLSVLILRTLLPFGRAARRSKSST